MRKDIVLIAALLFLSATAHATVWYVHPDSILNSIQAGLDACATDDTVLVGPGIYYENIDWPNTQGIDLRSEYGPDTTIIDGNNAGRVIEITTGVDTSTVIRGFTIRNGFVADWPGGGGISGGAATVTNNIITENTGGGIACVGSPTITNNTIAGNTGHGINYSRIDEDDTITITNNIITTNTGSGIYCGWFSTSNITGNTITGNTGSGIYLRVCDATVTNNTITGNTGRGITCAAYATITNNIITGNTTYEDGGGIGVWCPLGGAGGTIANNIITDNTATRGGGIYARGCDCGVGVRLFDNTIADNTATQRGGGIYCTDGNTPGDVLGMEIIGNTITGNTAPWGGGIYVFSYCLLPIQGIFDNTIADNNATQGGGGICFSDSAVSFYAPQITNNTIIDNTAPYGSGILCSRFSNLRIKYCTISANNGDGVYSESGANPVIHYNNITANMGYGVRNVEPSVLLDGCHNWWGDSSGPGGMGPGTGDEVSEWVNYADWFARPVILRDTVDFEPNTFNKKRHGKFVTVYFEMRDPYDPADIDLSKVRLWGDLHGYVMAESKPTCVGDYDKDGFPDRMIKFKSNLVNEVLNVGDSVKVSLEYDTGDWQWSEVWKRMLVDYIRVIEPGGPQNVESAALSKFSLASIYPNPFSGSTAIRFSISHSTHVTLKIYDSSGRLVKSLVNRKADSGKHTINWNACDNAGRNLSSGVYFLKFEVGDFKETEKLILLR